MFKFIPEKVPEIRKINGTKLIKLLYLDSTPSFITKAINV